MTGNGYMKIPSDANKGRVSFVSLLLFQWMNNVFKIGNERILEESDLLPLSKENTARSVTELLQTNWNKEKAKCEENGKRPKLWHSVIKILSTKDAMIMAFTFGLYSISRLLKPLFLGYLISSLMLEEPQKNYLLYFCALAMCVNTLIGNLGLHQACYASEVLGIKMSSALKGLIYHKVSTNRLYARQRMS